MIDINLVVQLTLIAGVVTTILGILLVILKIINLCIKEEVIINDVYKSQKKQ